MSELKFSLFVCYGIKRKLLNRCKQGFHYQECFPFIVEAQRKVQKLLNRIQCGFSQYLGTVFKIVIGYSLLQLNIL